MELTDAFFSFVMFLFIFWVVLTAVFIAMISLARQLNWFRIGD